MSTSRDQTGDKSAPRAASAVPRYSYYALLILSLVNFLNYIDRQVLPAVATSMQADASLKITDSDIGLMESSLLLSFTILAPIFGRLGDRYPRAKLMAVAAVLWSIATGMTGVVGRLPFVHGSLHIDVPFVQWPLTLSGVVIALCLVRACVGVGESAYSTITPSLIADFFPHNKRATALGVFQSAIPMGFALGFVIGGVLAHFFGWRVAFMIVGVPGLITAALVWTLREPRRGATDEAPPGLTLEDRAAGVPQTPRAEVNPASESGRGGESVLRTAWGILKTRDWLISTAAYTALTAALGAFATWAIIVLVRDKGMTQTGANITLGVVTLLAGATGTFGGGWIADRVAARRHNGYFLVCAVSTLVGVVPTLMVLIADDPRIYIPCVFFAVALLFTSNAPFHAILLESVPFNVRAMAVALNIVIIHACGDAISRLVVGLLSDSLKAGHFAALSSFAGLIGIDPARQHLTTALLVAPASLVVSTSLFFLGAKLQKKPRAAR
ncbi:MAG TPA: MFS transporter [Pyrinomonadaceae bacterium]|nr:MFS transporter [Pyrinomonadaceae bacterium]